MKNRIVLIIVCLCMACILHAQSCAEEDYLDLEFMQNIGPEKDEQGRKLSYITWVAPISKVSFTKEGQIKIVHPSDRDHCKEEESTIADPDGSLEKALQTKDLQAYVIISLTVRNGIPDKDWQFVMFYHSR